MRFFMIILGMLLIYLAVFAAENDGNVQIENRLRCHMQPLDANGSPLYDNKNKLVIIKGSYLKSKDGHAQTVLFKTNDALNSGVVVFIGPTQALTNGEADLSSDTNFTVDVVEPLNIPQYLKGESKFRLKARYSINLESRLKKIPVLSNHFDIGGKGYYLNCGQQK